MATRPGGAPAPAPGPPPRSPGGPRRIDIPAAAADVTAMPTLLQVALGGALGAALRWLAGLGVARLLGPAQTFPVAILGVNVLGSLLMGSFAVLAARRGLAHLQPFVMTGVLGGFTTFSAFSLEAVTLLERGRLGAAGLYAGLSVGLSIGALLLGAAIVRGLT